jgi:glutamine synthetase
MHTHMSLFRGEENLFADADADAGLSPLARSFIAGLLVHAREMTAITNQLVNSYKRLNEGYEAPQYVSWARNNQSALVRIPLPKRGKSQSTRIEYRAIDSACNPYLTYSVLLAAGLKGIDEGYELPTEAKGNLYEMSQAARAELGIRPLPDSLDHALEEMEASDLMRETLGDHIFSWFLRNRRAEWREYQRQVTQFELNRYLPIW